GRRLGLRLGTAAGVVGVGAGDVAGVAGVAGASVEQEAAHRPRRHPVELGVVQHRAMLVEGDDVGIGELVGILAGGLAIGQVDAELAGAGAEGALGRAVRAHAAAGGLGPLIN